MVSTVLRGAVPTHSRLGLLCTDDEGLSSFVAIYRGKFGIYIGYSTANETDSETKTKGHRPSLRVWPREVGNQPASERQSGVRNEADKLSRVLAGQLRTLT